MSKFPERYPVPFLKGRKFIRKLKELGLIVTEGDIYLDNKKECPSIGNHRLPVLFMEDRYSYRPVNLDEPLFEGIHKKIWEAYQSIIKI